MLMLDHSHHTTLFYFSSRDLDADGHTGSVKDWVRKLPSDMNLKPTWRSTHQKSTPPLTLGSTGSSYTLQLTQSAFRACAANISPQDDGVENMQISPSDIYETESDEQEAAVKSPPKGRQ